MSVNIHARFLIVLLVAFVALPAAAGTISVSWDPVSGASGYRVYAGTSSGSYSRVVDVGSATSYLLTGLADCTRHYVAVKAYNGVGESAQFSNEVSGWPRPQVASYTPTQVSQGAQVTLNITGSNFENAAQLLHDIAGLPTDESGNPLVRIENVAVVSCSQIQALVTVEPGASGFRAMEVGDFNVQFTVRNPDTVFGASSGSLRVNFRESRADINRSDAATRDRVDGKDLAWLAYSYGSSQGDSRYAPDCDQNGDGLIDGDDLVYVAVRFGRCWNGSSWTGSGCS